MSVSGLGGTKPDGVVPEPDDTDAVGAVSAGTLRGGATKYVAEPVGPLPDSSA